jgi:methionyl aminopeptidase
MSLKTAVEIDRMRLGATLLYRAFRELSDYIAPGRSTAEIDRFLDRALRRNGAQNALFGYRGFPAHACVSVNDVAAHGLPDRTMLSKGDIVSVDIAADLGGWKSDATWSFGVLPTPPEGHRLLEAAWRCTKAGLLAARAGARVGDVGAAIEAEAAKLGCAVIDNFAGHAIGRELHEDPLIPHTGSTGAGTVLEAGMVLNIEPIVTFGNPGVNKSSDGWSYRTADGAPTAQYELTLAILNDERRVLTLGGIAPDQMGEGPPFY